MRGHIARRGQNSWAVVLYIGRDPQTGKPKQKWFSHKTRREAEVHLAQLLSQVHGGGMLPDTKIRVGEFLEQWLRDYVEMNVATTTKAIYEEVVRLHLAPTLGHLPLQRLSPVAIQSHLSGKSQGGLSQATVHKIYRVLREALGHAVQWGLLSRNPCEGVKPPRLRRSEMRVLDEEQVRLFLGEAKRSSRYYALYLTALLTGMRLGELLGLRWKDVDLTLGVISVQQIFYRLGKQQIFKEPKSAMSRRTIALSPLLVEELNKLRSQQEDHRRLLGDGYKDHQLVFCQSDGRPLHAHNLTQRDFRRVLERAGLPHIRFHDLRHSHATHLLRQGVPPKVVQERLGHSNPAFTLAVYSHVLPGMQEDAVRALEGRLFGRD